MKRNRIFVMLVGLFCLLAIQSIRADGARAQGRCPATGTYGKDVGRDFYVQVVAQLKDVPPSDFAAQVLIDWEPLENTKAFWNPLATTWHMGGQDCVFNPPHDVQNYPDQMTGVAATAKTLNQGYYDAIRNMMAFRGFDREAMRTALGLWGSCSGTGCDSLLKNWEQLYNANRGTSAVPSSISTETVLLFDTSGSMADPDASGIVKLTAAVNAGKKLLDVINVENVAEVAAAHQVAIANFSESATVDTPATSDIAAAEQALKALATDGGTAMPKGLKAALELFPAQNGGKSFIILLSDGMPNIGLNDEQDESVSQQQVLDLATQAGGRGICIYTVGFGDPASGSINEDFLKQVAAKSGCGNYHNAADAWQLANVYIGLRHASTGQTLLSKTGSIQQDQVVDIGNVQVPDNQSMVLFTLNWPGSELDPILKDPKGQVVDGNYPGATVSLTDTLASIIIQKPLAGSWNVAAKGVQVPEGTTTYNAVLSVRPNPAQSARSSSGGLDGLPLAIILVILAGAGVIVYSIAVTARRKRQTVGGVPVVPARLTGSGGSVPVADRMLIGRSSACALRLDDPSISRRHAQIRSAGGRWYIQDLKSRAGVYVNGNRVAASVLNPGDRIRIGHDEFTFS